MEKLDRITINPNICLGQMSKNGILIVPSHTLKLMLRQEKADDYVIVLPPPGFALTPSMVQTEKAQYRFT